MADDLADDASSDDEDAKREWAELCASVSKPVGSPLRFAVGDRVECKLEDGYASATVVRVWYECKTEDGDPYDKAVPYQCRLDDGSLVFAPMDNDMCVRAPTDPRARSEAILLRAAAAAKAGDMDEAKRLMQLATDELAAARATAPPAVRVNAPVGIGEPRMGPLGPLGVPRLSQTARDAIARLERGEPEEPADAEEPAASAPRQFPAPSAGSSPYTISDNPGALNKRPGDPLRFAVGDAVECRMGPRGYVPAEIVDIWFEEETAFGDVPWIGPEDRIMPYQCCLDDGTLVFAHADHDMCVRAPLNPVPRRAAPTRDHIIKKPEGVSKFVMDKLFGRSVCCSSPNCNCAEGPMAVYRDMNGESQFMGIVRYSSLDIMPDETSVAGRGATSAGASKFTLVKLDDPQGPLDGPGHVMDDNEFLTEISLYDDMRPVGQRIEFTSMRAKDQSVLHRPFETGGNKFADVCFPFDVRGNGWHAGRPMGGTVSAHVRAGDEVKVLLEKTLPAEEALRLRGAPPGSEIQGEDGTILDSVLTSDRQWLDVTGVTTCGLVVAYPLPGGGPNGPMDSFMWSPELTRDKALVFTADCILCMKKGVNWGHEPL